MEVNRNHLFIIGLILMLVGLQFRFVQSFQLTTETTRFIHEKIEKKPPVSQSPLMAILPNNGANGPKRTFHPPKWLGWALISVGGVLVVKSLGMRKQA